MRVLVIDVGGSRVKFAIPGTQRHGSFPSSRTLTPSQMLQQLQGKVAGWPYEAVTVGYPGQVVKGKPAAEPPNLGRGWCGFNFAKAFKKPVKLINDAAMQALGSYQGGRMLFIGLGSGLGSALILEDIIVPLELGELTDTKGRKLVQVLGKKALKERGLVRWKRSLFQVIPRLAAAFFTDYLVLGGGGAKWLSRMPAGARRGSNSLAFVGGARLWTCSIRHIKHTWIIA